VKLVIGIVRPEKANEVLEALYRAEVRGLSMSRVQGHGGELDRVETYRGTTVKMGLAEKVRFEIAAPTSVSSRRSTRSARARERARSATARSSSSRSSAW
jgi:nitrogen regulatory protein PII